MLYVPQKKTSYRLAIPRAHGPETRQGVMTLTLSRGGNTYAFEGLADAGKNSLYYVVRIKGAEALPVGEYDYSLTAEDGSELSNGILTLGDFKRTVKANDTERKVIEYGG